MLHHDTNMVSFQNSATPCGPLGSKLKAQSSKLKAQSSKLKAQSSKLKAQINGQVLLK
jgi:hypothetical protein